MRVLRILAAIVAVAASGAVRAADGPYPKGLPQAPESFPLAVWLQDPSNADRYRAIGINTYVGLWRGPPAEQLDALDKAGIRLICGQSERSLRFKDRPTIVAWMHGDEPDNAQSLGRGRGYGPPVPSEKLVEGYRKLRLADPDRPVMLNLGQGVAWDNDYGRGVRTNHPEDYPEYLKGCDIPSFDKKRCERDGLELESMWLGEENLEPDDGTPVAIEQPTTIVTKPLSEKDQDDRVRMALGLTPDDPLPDVTYETLLAYHRYLSAHLKFPIYATFWEDSGPFSSKKVTATITGLADPQEGGINEGYGLAGSGHTPNGEGIEFPLDDIELGKKDPNRRLLDDYSYWYHNWR